MEKDWTYILEDSDAKVLIVATEAIYEKVKNYPGKVWSNNTFPFTPFSVVTLSIELIYFRLGKLKA